MHHISKEYRLYILQYRTSLSWAVNTASCFILDLGIIFSYCLVLKRNIVLSFFIMTIVY